MSENDVKIYNSKNDLDKSAAEISKALDEVMTHRLNGNLDKAMILGEKLASLNPTGGEGIDLNLKEYLAPKYFVNDILYQMRVLLAFAAETVLQFEIPVSIVTTTAIAAMYDKIEKQSPGLYDNLKNGAAFTFYYLAVQKGGNLSENIGEAFAMLCAVKNKEGFVNAGMTVWNKAVDAIEREIEKSEFKYI